MDFYNNLFNLGQTLIAAGFQWTVYQVAAFGVQFSGLQVFCKQFYRVTGFHWQVLPGGRVLVDSFIGWQVFGGQIYQVAGFWWTDLTGCRFLVDSFT